MERNIITKLIGGIGNQMFQYAAGRALAHRYGVDLLLDCSGFDSYKLRRYELDKFAINARLATITELNSAYRKSPKFLGRLGKALGIYQPRKQFKEASFAYDTRFDNIVPSVYLDGYWQSERYFLNIASQLREEFITTEPLDAANREILSLIHKECNLAVSLHIRRGDYVTNPQTTKYHGVCSLDYYYYAIDYIAGQIFRPHLFIFSDDQEWAKDNLKVSHKITFVNVNSTDQGIYDMTLMKACNHHIIANSSFSWWGAWLNARSDKIVVAPRLWFADELIDTKDLLPNDWIRI